LLHFIPHFVFCVPLVGIVPDIHDDDVGVMFRVGFVPADHRYPRLDRSLPENAVELEIVGRAAAGDELSKMAPQIFAVLEFRDFPKEILSDGARRRAVSPLDWVRTRIKDVSRIVELEQAEHFSRLCMHYFDHFATPRPPHVAAFLCVGPEECFSDMWAAAAASIDVPPSAIFSTPDLRFGKWYRRRNPSY
jgi:hypothetical protein